MNKTEIEWCDSTWNPVTGCLYGCDYCYARGIAHRFAGCHRLRHGSMHNGCYELDVPAQRKTKSGKWMAAAYPFDFEPTFHRYRLREPMRTRKPKKIFVCSMADLFGEWVPDEWIKQVFAACELAPQHQYLFLTKNPQRYNDLFVAGILPIADNFWYGGTRTGIDTYREHEAAMSGRTFLSIEPIHGPMGDTIDALELWDWVIIGAETGDRKEKVIPRREWITEIADYCQSEGVPVFMKNSLVSIVGEENMLRQWPEAMKCGS